MRQVGIADLGSNTARLVVFEFEPGGAHRMLEAIREPVRLGEGLAADGRLTPNAVARALAAVELFEDYAVAARLDDLEILATSAVRDADNSEEVLGPIRDQGYSVRVLSGEEEAELGVLAAANGFDVDDGWVTDLGGGSMQLSRMEHRRYTGGTAFPLGAVRLTERFLGSDPPSAREIADLEAYVATQLGDLAAEIRASGLPLIGMGGTVRNLARLEMRRDGYPLAVLHGYRLSRPGLDAITDHLLAMSLAERVSTAGIRPYRADIIVAGALVFRWLLREANLEAIEISGHGVREGALYRHLLQAPHLVNDVRRATIENLATLHGQVGKHTDWVGSLARALFRGLTPLHGLEEDALELLGAAATLHDVGTQLDYYRHHKHGAYLVASVPLPGFTHREHALLSLLVRYHRKGTPKVEPFAGLLDDDDLSLLRQLAACLRMAESLERSRAGRVANLQVAVDDETIRLELTSQETLTVELWEAAQHRALFRDAFGRDLELSVGG